MSHFCHAVGCGVEVPPRLWGCAKHWSMVPRALQRELLRHYVSGQETRKDPTPEYIAAARACIAAVAEREGRATAPPRKDATTMDDKTTNPAAPAAVNPPPAAAAPASPPAAPAAPAAPPRAAAAAPRAPMRVASPFWPGQRVALLGSMAKMPAMRAIELSLGRKGVLVDVPVAAPPPDPRDAGALVHQAIVRDLCALHRAKIAGADLVLVVDVPDGYVGEDTLALLEFARQRGKPYRMLSDVHAALGAAAPAAPAAAK